MRLVFSAACIILKKSASAIICALLCLAIIAAAVSAASSIAEAEPVKIAIVNHDDSSMMLPLVTTMLESRLDGMLKAELCDTEDQAQSYAAMLILPHGFFNSVMSGENIAPKLTVNAPSPFEGLWISSVVQTAARLISKAQNVVGAVNTAADEAGLSPDERNKVIMSLNGYLLNDYLTRKDRFESVILSATGSINAVQHYMSAAVSFFCFITAFLLFPSIKELRDFSVFSGKRVHCLTAAAVSCLLLAVLITFSAAFSLQASKLMPFNLIKTALLLFSIMLFFPSVSKNSASCAAFCCVFCMFQAVFGGFLLPEALLPSALSTASQFFPMSVFRKALADTVWGCGFKGNAVLFGWCILLNILSSLSWMRKGDAG